jgi:predicted dehydrogenase
MGNQGTSHDGFRQGVALLQSDMLGQPKEIHVWTNRPIWPQGIKTPEDTPGVPNTVRWYEFLGPAHDRPYHPSYQPFNWRGWLDFGTGALGDMACHTMNVAVMGLELYDPESVEVVETSGIVDNASYPVWSIIRSHFGSTEKRGPVTLTWYDGGDKLPRDKRPYADMLEGAKPSASGLLIVGSEGSFYSHNDYGAEHVLLPKDKYKDKKEPERKLPKSPGHFQEFVDAITDNDPKKAFSNFDYAGRLTETVLLGVVALRAGGKIQWDAANMKVTNNTDANQYIKRDYRKGFSIHQ